MAQHRTSSAHALAALAMAEVAGAGSKAGHASLPGFAIDRPALAGRKPAQVRGRAEVKRLRTGEVETLAYQASTHGPLSVQCRVGRTHLTLKALPEEAREPIVFALLARLALALRVSGRECLRALELARVSGGAGLTVAPGLRPAFGDLLRRLLEHPAAEAEPEAIQAVGDMLGVVPEAVHDEARRRTEEWVWMGLQAARGRHAAPTGLEALADRLGVERPHPARARR